MYDLPIFGKALWFGSQALKIAEILFLLYTLVRKLSLYHIQTYHICNQTIHVGYAKSWWLPKHRPFDMSATGFRATENQLAQLESSLDADQKW